jgi:hypothetical protein
VKLPVILPSAPILVCTTGAEITTSSRTIAIWRPILAAVAASKAVAPSLLKRMETAGLPSSSIVAAASARSLPET